MSTSAMNYDVGNSTQILSKPNLIVCSRRQSIPRVGIFYGENPFDFAFPLLMLELSMAVIVTLLVRQILKPFRQPRIVSEIIGGVIVGQLAVGSGTNFRAHMFPADARFVLRNIGLLGFMYFLFLAGVKTDVRLIKRAGKSQWVIAVVSVLIPMMGGIIAAVVMRKGGLSSAKYFSSLFGVTALFSATAFPVLNPIIKELNLLSSEIGRLVLSLALITVVIGINTAVIFESSHQASISLASGAWSILSFLFLSFGIILGIRRAMYKLVKETPPGKPIPEIYVVCILLGVMVTGFLSDVFGMAICNGPMWLGLAIPDGPPLGAILVEKTETIVDNFLMPLGYVFLGMTIELPFIGQNSQTVVSDRLVYVALTVVFVKMISTLIACYFVKLPVKEALGVTMLMNMRGQMEILLLLRFVDFGMFTARTAAAVVFIIVTCDAASSLVLSFIFNPAQPYMVTKRRTIQHTPQNSEIRVIACFFDDNSVIGVLNLLALSNPSHSNSPICIYALHLIELVAQAQPIRIEHGTENIGDFEDGSSYSYTSSLYRVLDHFKNSIRQDIEINLLTVITAKKTMYQDICEIALLKKASLIVLPLEHELGIPTPISITVTTPAADSTARKNKQLNNDVLDHAPCSVAIFTNTNNSTFSSDSKNLLRLSCRRSSEYYYIIVLFMGGADSREALSYADRITATENVYLTVIRFLARDDRGDDKLEKKLDDGLITWFWVKHESSRRIFYKEVIVSNGEDTISAIQDLASDDCDLFILGRKHGVNPVLLQGLTDWSENSELGPLGDYIAASEIGRKASVIVMQQQILRLLN